MSRHHRPAHPVTVVDDVTRLFGSTWSDVVRFVQRRVGCPALAEDVAATVFAEALRSQERGVRIERGWLFTVAQRRIVDHHRRTARRAELYEYVRALGRIEAVESPTDHIDDLLDAMQRLSTVHRVALAARYLDGRSVGEIADQLGLSYKAAESTLARARRALSATLSEDRHRSAESASAAVAMA